MVATVVESAIVAAVGAVIGIVIHLLLVPLVGLIPFRGEALGATSVLLPVPIVLAIVAAIILLAATSAAIGLRKVVISPLGVRTRAVAGKSHWIRAVITVVALVDRLRCHLRVPVDVRHAADDRRAHGRVRDRLRRAERDRAVGDSTSRHACDCAARIAPDQLLSARTVLEDRPRRRGVR